MNLHRVPPQLHPLIALAQRFGVIDDDERARLVSSLDQTQREHLLSSVRALEPQLLAWLAGPEADILPPSREYLAFSALLRAHDEALAV